MSSKKDTKKIDYILDATNIINWHTANKAPRNRAATKNEKNDNVSLNTLFKLLNMISDEGRSFQCIFDANTVYLLPEDEKDLYNELLSSLPEFFYQVTGGIRADSFVLAAANRCDSRVISNDNFSDYQKKFPWIGRDSKPQRLFKGGIPLIAGTKTLMVPDLQINEPIDETAEILYHELMEKLGGETEARIGQIKSFNKKNGWGFIERESGKDVYFKAEEFLFNPGMEVTFKVNRDGDKTFATEIGIQTNSFEEVEAGQVLEGTIDWYDNEKDFGAIREDNADDTIFFFGSGFEHQGLKPEVGMRVAFEKKINKKGPYGVRIRLVDLTPFLAVGARTTPASSSANRSEEDRLKRYLNLANTLLRRSEAGRFQGTVQDLNGKKGYILLDNSSAILGLFAANVNKGDHKLANGAKVDFSVEWKNSRWSAEDVDIIEAASDKQDKSGKQEKSTKSGKPEKAKSESKKNAPSKRNSDNSRDNGRDNNRDNNKEGRDKRDGRGNRENRENRDSGKAEPNNQKSEKQNGKQRENSNGQERNKNGRNSNKENTPRENNNRPERKENNKPAVKNSDRGQAKKTGKKPLEEMESEPKANSSAKKSSKSSKNTKSKTRHNNSVTINLQEDRPTHETRTAQKTTVRTENKSSKKSAEKNTKDEKPVKMSKLERLEKADQESRLAKVEKVEKAVKVEKAEKSAKTTAKKSKKATAKSPEEKEKKSKAKSSTKKTAKKSLDKAAEKVEKTAEKKAAPKAKKLEIKSGRKCSQNAAKLVFWAKNTKGESILAALRYGLKDTSLDLWLFPLDAIKENVYENLMDDSKNIDTRVLPRKFKPKSLDFKNEKPLPKGLKPVNQKVVKETINTWYIELLSNKLFKVMDGEITKLQKKVKKLKSFDKDVWDAAISLGDKVIQSSQEKEIPKSQIVDLRTRISEIFDILRQLKDATKKKKK